MCVSTRLVHLCPRLNRPKNKNLKIKKYLLCSKWNWRVIHSSVRNLSRKRWSSLAHFKPRPFYNNIVIHQILKWPGDGRILLHFLCSIFKARTKVILNYNVKIKKKLKTGHWKISMRSIGKNENWKKLIKEWFVM